MSHDEHSDLERVRRAREGEPAAVEWLTQLLLRISAMVRSLAVRFGIARWVDLRDVEQEAAATAIRRLDSFHGRKPFEAWLFQICKLTLRGCSRRARRQQMPGIVQEPVDEVPGPEQLSVSAERAARVRAALERLGGKEAEVIRQRHFEQLDFRDIAARAGIPLATVRTRYYRGLEALRDRLREEPEDGPT